MLYEEHWRPQYDGLSSLSDQQLLIANRLKCFWMDYSAKNVIASWLSQRMTATQWIREEQWKGKLFSKGLGKTIFTLFDNFLTKVSLLKVHQKLVQVIFTNCSSCQKTEELLYAYLKTCYALDSKGVDFYLSRPQLFQVISRGKSTHGAGREMNLPLPTHSSSNWDYDFGKRWQS